MRHLKFLVAERRSGWYRYDIKPMMGSLMAGIAGLREMHIGILERREVLLPDGLAKAVKGRGNHGQGCPFWTIGTILLDPVQTFLDLIDFKICQFPVLIDAGKPELVVMDLNTAHKLPKSWLVGILQRCFQAVNLVLQLPVMVRRMAAGGHNEKQQSNAQFFHDGSFWNE